MRLRSIAIPMGALFLALLPGIPAHADPSTPSPITDSRVETPEDGLTAQPRPGLDAYTYTASDGQVRLDDATVHAESLAPQAAEGDQEVQVRFETPTGAAPESMQVNLQNQTTGKVYYLRPTAEYLAGGVVPPGEYTALAYEQIAPHGDVPGFLSLTYHRITVADQPVALAVTMADLTRLEFDVDQTDAVLHDAEFRLQANIGDSPNGMSYTTIVEGRWDLYSASTGSANLLFAVRPTLIAPDSAEYDYHLVFHSDNGVPGDLSFDVPDRKLARITSEYPTRGEPFLLMRNSYGRVGSGYDSAYVTPKVALNAPTTRVEYYTADPAVEWFHQAEFGDADQPVPDWFVRYGGFYESGRSRVQWGDAPVGPGLVPDRYQYAMARTGDRITGITPLFSGPDADEITWSKVGVTGTSVLTRNGVEVGRNTTRPEVQQFALPAGDAGTYQLTVDATHDVPWSDLGTHGTTQWTFHSGKTAARQLLDLSVVSLDATGVRNGYAPRWLPQVVTLDVHRQGAAAETTAMTMEVSYDDGLNWRSVPLLRSGDKSVALLWHPTGAAYVSTRLTAANDAGDSVSSTTIRSYGLK